MNHPILYHVKRIRRPRGSIEEGYHLGVCPRGQEVPPHLQETRDLARGSHWLTRLEDVSANMYLHRQNTHRLLAIDVSVVIIWI